MQTGVRLWIFIENDVFKGRPWLLLLPSCFVVMHISNKSKLQHYHHHQQRQTTNFTTCIGKKGEVRFTYGSCIVPTKNQSVSKVITK